MRAGRAVAALAAVASCAAWLSVNRPISGATYASTFLVDFTAPAAATVNVTCVPIAADGNYTTPVPCVTNLAAASGGNYVRCNCYDAYVSLNATAVAPPASPVRAVVQLQSTYGANATNVTDTSAAFNIDYALQYPGLSVTKPLPGDASILFPARVAWVATGGLSGNVQPYCIGRNFTSGANTTVACGTALPLSSTRSVACSCYTSLGSKPFDAFAVRLASTSDPTVATETHDFTFSGSYAIVSNIDPSGGNVNLGVRYTVGYILSRGVYGTTNLPANMSIDLMAYNQFTGASTLFARLGYAVPSGFAVNYANVTLPADAPSRYYVMQVSDADDPTTFGQSSVAFQGIVPSATPTPTWSPGYTATSTASVTITATGTASMTPSRTGTPSARPTEASLTPLPPLSPTPLPSFPGGASLTLTSPVGFVNTTAGGGAACSDTNCTTTSGTVGQYMYYGVPVAWLAGPELTNVTVPVSVTVSCTLLFNTVSGPVIQAGSTPVVVPSVALGFTTIPCTPPPSAIGVVRGYVNVTGTGIAVGSDIFVVSTDTNAPRLVAATLDNAASQGGVFLTGQSMQLRWVARNYDTLDRTERMASIELWKGMRQVSVLVPRLDLTTVPPYAVQIPTSLASISGLTGGSGYYVVMRDSASPNMIIAATSSFAVTIPVAAASRTPTTSPIPVAPAPKTMSLLTIIAIALGGAAILLIVTVLTVWACRRNRKKKDIVDDEPEEDDEDETKMIEMPAGMIKARSVGGGGMAAVPVRPVLTDFKVPEGLPMLPSMGFQVALPSHAVALPVGAPRLTTAPPLIAHAGDFGGGMSTRTGLSAPAPAAGFAGPGALEIVNPLTPAQEAAMATGASTRAALATQSQSRRSVRRCSLE